ncbi:MAG TPA: tyrosine-type recombinase/integrase [Paraburkholderia sp.]|nr:tyrosine-type recombinase/integrase [Paraburkholderia sp.]
MPRAAVPLNEPQIRELKPRPTRYSIADGNGLVLEIMPTGSKIWRFRFSLNGARQPTVTIGDYRLISLRVAREKAKKYAALVAQGISPVPTVRQDRGSEKRVEFVREAAELYMAAAMAKKSDEYRRTTQRALEKDVLPAIGNKRPADVTAEDVLAICEKIKGRGSPKMALHTRNVVKRLYEFLIARQLATTNPATVIPARFIATTESRTRVVSADEIGSTLRAIYASGIRRPLKLALHLLVLTMVRKSDLIDARWSEFDLDAALWKIPAARMKRDHDHWVCLPHQAVSMLNELRQSKTSEAFVFPTTRGADRPIAGSTLNQAVKALGHEVEHFVLHDFRHTAASHLSEMGEPAEAIEDTISVTAEQASGHRRMLQSWADFADAQISRHRLPDY